MAPALARRSDLLAAVLPAAVGGTGTLTARAGSVRCGPQTAEWLDTALAYVGGDRLLERGQSLIQPFNVAAQAAEAERYSFELGADARDVGWVPHKFNCPAAKSFVTEKASAAGRPLWLRCPPAHVGVPFANYGRAWVNSPHIKRRWHQMAKPDAQPVKEIMTLADVAAYLRCHPSSIYRLLKRGEIPAFRIGSDWRFRRADIDRWIEDLHAKGLRVGDEGVASGRTIRPYMRRAHSHLYWTGPARAVPAADLGQGRGAGRGAGGAGWGAGAVSHFAGVLRKFSIARKKRRPKRTFAPTVEPNQRSAARSVVSVAPKPASAKTANMRGGPLLQGIQHLVEASEHACQKTKKALEISKERLAITHRLIEDSRLLCRARSLRQAPNSVSSLERPALRLKEPLPRNYRAASSRALLRMSRRRARKAWADHAATER